MTEHMQHNISLKPYNTFGIDVQASTLYQAESVDDLIADLPRLKQHSPLMILGGGSNILLTQDVEGTVIKMANRGIGIIDENDQQVTLRIAAGENWHQLVMHCVAQGWGGIENLSLIPGCVGAAPLQNIGAYGVELKDVFCELTAIDIESSQTKIFNKQACQFDYRYSTFKAENKNKYIITDVTLCLSKHPQPNTSYRGLDEWLQQHNITSPTIKDVSNAVIAIRQQKLPDPAVIGNAGSFFKNPIIDTNLFDQLASKHPTLPHYIADNETYKIPAAWLIEQCGFKGKRIDQIGVHDKQALVLVNHGDGDGHAIAELAKHIQQTVLDTFHVPLEMEVNII